MKISRKAKENIIGGAVIIIILAGVCFYDNEMGASFTSYLFPLLFMATIGEWLLYKNEKKLPAFHKKRMALKGKKVACFIIQFIVIFTGIMMINQSLYINPVGNIIIGFVIGIFYALGFYFTSNQSLFSEDTDEESL